MNAAPVATKLFGFVSVIVRIDVSFVPIEDGVKAFATPGAVATTRLAVAEAVLAPAFVDVTLPAASVLA